MPIPVIPDPADPGSGPQKVLSLTEAGMTQTEIAAELHVAQSTVSRWLKAARQSREIHYQSIARNGFLVLMAACAVVITIAVSYIAWG